MAKVDHCQRPPVTRPTSNGTLPSGPLARLQIDYTQVGLSKVTITLVSPNTPDALSASLQWRDAVRLSSPIV